MHDHPRLGIAAQWLLMALLLLLRLPLDLGFPTIDTHSSYNNNARGLEKTPILQPHLEETIEEVQKILAQDGSLPRLTRGEIEELYEKVTREEYERSLGAGDVGRADSMRALMLVLPYNTDNNTEENLQELYTRPPVTKVIDAYPPPQPIKFVTPDPSAGATLEPVAVGNLAATTYKPSHPVLPAGFGVGEPGPTTYHPSQPDRRETPKPFVQRFSSHYSAKDAEFLKRAPAKRTQPRPATTVRPVADVLEGLGIVGQAAANRKRFSTAGGPDDFFYPAESAPQPVVSSFVPQALAPRIKADAYASFKPLNIGEEIRVKPEVEDYLTRFGIVGGRRRKALKKGAPAATARPAEQTGEESEIATAKVPAVRPGGGGGSELEKLLSNLQELERLNVNAKALTKKKATAANLATKPTTTTTTTTTTTSTTTPRPPTSAELITNGAPRLVEPKKPRRRIDPNLDINFGATGNQQQQPQQDQPSQPGGADELQKLLANLQELEKLRINPEKVLKTVAPAVARTTTRAPARTQGLANRFSTSEQQQVQKLLQQQLLQQQLLRPQPAQQQPLQQQQTLFAQQQQLLQQLQKQQQSVTKKSGPQGDLDQLQRVLQELETLERSTARATTKAPTPAPPRAATANRQRPNFGLGDFDQLRKLLTDDRELERLYEQARASRKPSPQPTTSTTTTSTTTTTTTSTTTPKPTTTTTTRKPGPSLSELQELQKYFAELERSRTPAPTTSTSTTTTTTTTSTTPAPASNVQRPFAGGSSSGELKAKSRASNDQLQELINRVQQLERLNSPPATEGVLPSLGFTTRNVKAAAAAPASSSATANDYRIPSNDFAHLQQLYRQVQEAERSATASAASGGGQIEISTAATASKHQQQQQAAGSRTKSSQDFAQRIIDITNDTGSGSSLQEVDPSDFVQLQKLLSKVQELERVKITADGQVQPVTPNPRAKATKTQREAAPTVPNLVTAASVRTNHVQALEPQQLDEPKVVVYAEKPSLVATGADLRLDLPTYVKPKPKQPAMTSWPTSSQAPPEPSSSEELRELALSAPAHPKGSATFADHELERYQKLFASLEDAERHSYRQMQQPPMIRKTTMTTTSSTKEPPRFVATRRPQELAGARTKAKAEELEELQKLLNNAQELEKLGVSLPKELSQQIETKLTATKRKETPPEQGTVFKRIPSAPRPTSLASAELLDPPEVEEYLARFGILATEPPPAPATTPPKKDASKPSVPESAEQQEEDEEEPVAGPRTKAKTKAVFSLTTAKSTLPREPRPTTTESPVELPVFSATKIIEAAIKRAATRIGVTTERPQGFRRRSDVVDQEEEDMLAGEGEEPGDLMGDFSEMSFQLAIPEINRRLDPAVDPVVEQPQAEIKGDLSELQRLIGNLQELQRLNLSISSDVVRQADAKYLASFKGSATAAEDDSKKNRRQSATEAAAAAPTSAPTRVNLGLSLDDSSSNDDGDIDASANSSTTEGTTASTTTTTTTTTEEPRNGSLADLEDSFGPDPLTENPPPAKKKNGFYFLADWNSFLEVGEGDEQVVVRLSPKIGDPRLFLPVSVP